ncbi:hypothetical protein J4Q44_G00207980 [Coregonus suidteri]|uniref:Uncharacterized protein n=1 Tax=Coregonus suidteri TaxID=861788 RepID=A0AAN8QMS4_9TELE
MARTMFETGTSIGRKIHRSYWGLINNYRYLSREAVLLHAVENARARKSHQKNNKITNQRKGTDENIETQDTIQRVKNIKLPERHTCLEVGSTLKPTDSRTHLAKCGVPLTPIVQGSLTAASGDNRVANRQTSVSKKLFAAALSERWEVDSGFLSEASPPPHHPELADTVLPATACARPLWWLWTVRWLAQGWAGALVNWHAAAWWITMATSCTISTSVHASL